MDLEAAETLALSLKLCSFLAFLLLFDRPSCTIDMRGCASSLCSGGSDRPVLLALIRDIPVGFWYIEGELAESSAKPEAFLCSFISG